MITGFAKGRPSVEPTAKALLRLHYLVSDLHVPGKYGPTAGCSFGHLSGQTFVHQTLLSGHCPESLHTSALVYLPVRTQSWTPVRTLSGQTFVSYKRFPSQKAELAPQKQNISDCRDVGRALGRAPERRAQAVAGRVAVQGLQSALASRRYWRFGGTLVCRGSRRFGAPRWHGHRWWLPRLASCDSSVRRSAVGCCADGLLGMDAVRVAPNIRPRARRSRK